MSKKKENTNSLVSQFCTVTGADKTVGKQLLEACAGNLEMAINMHMEGAGLGAAGTSSASGYTDDVRAPIPQTQEILVEDAPAYGIFRGRKRKTHSVFDGFRDFQEEARQQELELFAGTSGSSEARKTRTLQDLFRPPIDMTYKGNLAKARETGKAQGKWVMVNIQNVQEFPCQALNRDVWSNSAVKTLIKDNFIFWQVYHDSEEGQRYAQFYKVDQWPYVAVLDPQTGENMVVWNKIEPLTFCDLVTEFLTRHPALDCLSPTHQAAKRVRREESVLDASEDEQLQAAITASLTEVSAPACAKDSEVVTESDTSDLETFTDSEEESQPSPVKTRQRSGSADPNTRSQRCCSPSRRQSPCRHSGDEGSKSESDTHTKTDSAKRRSTRCNSPLASSSVNAEETKRTPRKCSPKRVKNTSPGVEKVSLPRKSSPDRKRSPKKSQSPVKTASIHNDVHPAVLENIRRYSTSEDEGDKEVSIVKDTSTENMEASASDQSMETVSVDSRDYKKYLGPDSDEKTTLMLRLPDGQKEKLCIAFSSKLLALVLFVGAKGFSNERFELIAQFPRRQLSQLDYDKTLREIGLHAQETIFVQART